MKNRRNDVSQNSMASSSKQQNLVEDNPTRQDRLGSQQRTWASVTSKGTEIKEAEVKKYPNPRCPGINNVRPTRMNSTGPGAGTNSWYKMKPIQIRLPSLTNIKRCLDQQPSPKPSASSSTRRQVWSYSKEVNKAELFQIKKRMSAPELKATEEHSR
ncbi:unnamed protein product [Allacma fusca]|uniref:Uncharacterized protein n=1 Tax=Allacma fusca TaxID=39272 RepID=A0A8J2LMF1_9HEXA|nr:unnamed protein product [Allacma fusca]